ncbi:Piso0_005302 [Millerozyma farinosa CBS 7064]|uniref:Mitochondrial inner membrane protease subunit n=1 Tax=Pichia sorbitophila (strain ATCC MYA-4447 / BCRC 22081 / CBS 7064 / NBRC 10061 / NRRL Y-12695) TaxID=559304 RepID=G8Y1T6_PICSO|nr:Piso0_005302 [Millerozyma farinosa CBS 7064]CCE86789.1 Piso0_005302 [Millerozyma farinosa CBS 7064]
MVLVDSPRFLASTISWTLKAGCVVHLVHEFVYEFTETRGESMLPTLQPKHDYVHALKKYRLGKGLKIGDCIVATKPSDPDQRVCKRITGMPGDIILIDPSSSSELTNSPSSCVYHDGFNKYIKVPEGHVWVTGDNLCHSLDSRSYSVLPMALIKGKIVAANSMDKGLRNSDGSFWFWNFRWITNTFVSE